MKSNSSVLSRHALELALLDQPVCCHNRSIAKWFVANGVRSKSIKNGTVLIREGHHGTKDVFCILSGRFRIEIGGHTVDFRERHIHIGEMAFILNEARTASCIAAEDSVVAFIPQYVFAKACVKFPGIWAVVAKTLCQRLHQRKKFFRVKNQTPRVFLGSSGASVWVAKKLASLLRTKLGSAAEVVVWENKKIFKPSCTLINALTEKAKTSDFGIFILAADDILIKKNVRSRKSAPRTVPRDNVIFEAGLFTAACGLERTFFVCEDHPQLHVPTDLAGVVYLKFKATRKTKTVQFGRTVFEITESIKTLKVI